MGITSNDNMPSTQLTLILVAALIAPAYSSLTFGTTKSYSAAGCSAATLIEDKIEAMTMAGPADGSCGMNGEAEQGSSTYAAVYEKSTCTDATTNGYTYGQFTDSACTIAKTTTRRRVKAVTESTGVCEAHAWKAEWKQYGCVSTSETLGAVNYGVFSTADCADASIQMVGYYMVNFCNVSSSNSLWSRSTKTVIENAKLVGYEYTTAGGGTKDCSGTATPTGTPATPAACTAIESHPGQWLKVGNMIDGSGIDGADTITKDKIPTDTTGNTATSAAISVFLGFVCTVLNLMFC